MLQHGRVVAFVILSGLVLAGCQAKTPTKSAGANHQSDTHIIKPKYPQLYGSWSNAKGERIRINAQGQITLSQADASVTGQVQESVTDQPKSYQFKLDGKAETVYLRSSQAANKSSKSAMSLTFGDPTEQEASQIFYKEEMTITLKN